VPLASFMIESVLVQPQALALGVPIAGTRAADRLEHRRELDVGRH
jgi:hypothetical protein